MSKGAPNWDSINDLKVEDICIGIACSQWNETIMSKLLEGCVETLKNAGIKEENLIIKHVPGTFELPTTLSMINKAKAPEAFIALGCVIKGETSHDIFISQAVANALANLGMHLAKPVIFGVVTTNNEDQALERSGGSHGHKGIEAAQTALAMLGVKEDLNTKQKSIGF